MTKKQFIEQFNNEDHSVISNLYDKFDLCKKTDRIIYSDIFLPPQIWNKLIKLESSLGILVETCGLSEDSEKQMVAFKSFYSYEELNFPITYLKIDTTSKFHSLEHRHFLASILSTGIKRDKLGDLVVEDGTCYLVICNSLSEFLKTHLTQIGKLKINFKEISSTEIPKGRFHEISNLITSTRLDSIVAAVANISRNDSVKLISSSQVMLNYNVTTNKSLVVKEKDVISIRKYGKFIFLGSQGETKKGRIKGKFHKFG